MKKKERNLCKRQKEMAKELPEECKTTWNH